MRELFLGVEPSFDYPTEEDDDKANKKRAKKGESAKTAAELYIDGIEASPYYWWWYALTLSDDYRLHTLYRKGKERELCSILVEEDVSGMERHKFLALYRGLPNGLTFKRAKVYERITSREIHQVFDDFGDVSFIGDRYEAFKDWWRSTLPLRNNDPVCERFSKKVVSRGEYLFAEPLLDGRVQVIDTLSSADSALQSDTHTLISIPTSASKQYIEEQFARLMARHHLAFKERTVRDIQDSQALYKLSKRQSGDKLKAKFLVNEHFEENPNASNASAGDDLGIKSISREEHSAAAYDSDIQKISRMRSDYQRMMKNVTRGRFV